MLRKRFTRYLNILLLIFAFSIVSCDYYIDSLSENEFKSLIEQKKIDNIDIINSEYICIYLKGSNKRYLLKSETKSNKELYQNNISLLMGEDLYTSNITTSDADMFITNKTKYLRNGYFFGGAIILIIYIYLFSKSLISMINSELYGSFEKFLWFIIILFIPILGSSIYLIAKGKKQSPTSAKKSYPA